MSNNTFSDLENIDNQDKVMSLGSFFTFFKRNLPLITILTSAATIVSIVYSLIATEVYESSAIMTHNTATDQTKAISSVADLVTGTASGQSSEEKIAVTRILSKDYFKRIYDNDYLLTCLLDSCDASNFSEKAAKGKLPTSRPNFIVAYRKFRASFKVFPNYETLIFSFKHKNPSVSFQYLNWLIDDSNNFVRDIEIQKSQNAIDFFTEKLQETRNIEVQKILGSLIQEDFSKLSLSRKSKYYAFEILDNAIFPSERIFPKRSLIVSSTIIITFVASIFILVLLDYLGFFTQRIQLINARLLELIR